MSEQAQQGEKSAARVDTESGDSTRAGLLGLIESFLRKHLVFAQLLTMSPLIFVYVFCIGTALTPFFLLLNYNLKVFSGHVGLIDIFLLIVSLGFSFVAFIHILIFIVPLFNLPVRRFVRPHRGGAFSLENIAWMYHNALTYLVRYTVLELITPSPLAILFYRMMGMKVGKGVIINTTNISDPCLITIEDNVFIGGSAHLMGHMGVRGYLILAPVVIKKGATIGLKSSVMADVVVGEKAVVKPHTIVLPKTRIPDGETY